MLRAIRRGGQGEKGRGGDGRGRRRTGTQPKRLDPRRARQRLVERIRAVGEPVGWQEMKWE